MENVIKALRKVSDEIEKLAVKYQDESKIQDGGEKLESIHKASAIYKALLIIEKAITNYHLTPKP